MCLAFQYILCLCYISQLSACILDGHYYHFSPDTGQILPIFMEEEMEAKGGGRLWRGLAKSRSHESWEQYIHHIAVDLSSSDTIIEKKKYIPISHFDEAVLSDRNVPWDVECSPPLSTLGSSCSLAALRWPSQQWRGSEGPWPGGSCRGRRCGPLLSTNLPLRSAWCLRKSTACRLSASNPKAAARKQIIWWKWKIVKNEILFLGNLKINTLFHWSFWLCEVIFPGAGSTRPVN